MSNPTARRSGHHRDRLRRRLWWLVVAVLFAASSHGNFAGSGDAVHYMVIARSLASDQDLDLADDYAARDSLILGGELSAGDHARPGVGGVLRPVHDVGLPLATAPAFAAAWWTAAQVVPRLPQGLRRRLRLSPWIALRQLLGLGMIALAAWLAGALFDIVAELTGGHRSAFWIAALGSVAPPVASHAAAYFTEIPSACLAFGTWLRLRRRPPPAPLAALALGTATGYLLLLHARNVAIAFVLLGLALARLRHRRRSAAALVAGFAAAAVLRTAINHHFWGTWVVGPHARPGPWPGLAATVAEAGTRLFGLLLDQEHGLLLQAPIYLLVPAGLACLARRRPRLAAEIALVAAAYVASIALPMTNPHGFRGGWSPAGRFLLPIAPFLAVAVAAALAAAREHRRGRLLAGAIVVLQLGLAALFWQRPMLAWAGRTGRAPFLVAIGGDGWTRFFPSADRLDAVAVGWAIGTIAIAAGATHLLARPRPA